MTDPTIDKAALEAALNAVPSFAGGQSKVEGDRTIGDKLGFGHGTPNPRAYVEAAIAAYLAALPPTTDGVSVKPLEWVRNASMDSWEAQSPIGSYLSQRTVNDTASLWRGSERLGVYLTHSEAKAAAQADYTARIMASLNISEAEPVARYDIDPGESQLFIDEKPDGEWVRWNDLAAIIQPLYASPTTPEGVRDDVLATAARELIASRFDTYRAGNNRQVGIQDDNGEKCWIVPFDEMAALEAALKGNRT